MADFGYMTVTTTCPVNAPDGDTETRVYGENEQTVFKNAVCPEGHEYTVGVEIVVEGDPTAYVID